MKESEVAQLCLTLCNPMDCSLPGSSVHGIFQAIVLEWIAISFSKYLKSYFFEISLNGANILYTTRPTSWSSMTPYFHAWPLKTSQMPLFLLVTSTQTFYLQTYPELIPKLSVSKMLFGTARVPAIMPLMVQPTSLLTKLSSTSSVQRHRRCLVFSSILLQPDYQLKKKDCDCLVYTSL